MPYSRERTLASKNRKQRIVDGIAVTLAAASLTSAVWRLAGGETSKPATSAPQETSTETASLPSDPVSRALLDCRRANITAFPDPDGANKRRGPGAEFEVVGKVNAGISLKVEDVIKETHIEGYNRYWVVIVDSTPVPKGNITDGLRSSYALTVPANSLRPGALGTNGNFSDCEVITK